MSVKSDEVRHDIGHKFEEHPAYDVKAKTVENKKCTRPETQELGCYLNKPFTICKLIACRSFTCQNNVLRLNLITET